MNTYGLLKALHVLSVVFWIGGTTALWIVTLSLARAGNRPTVASILPLVLRYGRSVMGPASVIVLITGITMAILGGVGQALWVQLGMLGILLHFVLGATVVRRAWMRLGRVVAESAGTDEQLAAATRRTTIVSWVYLLLMASVIAIMVLKPTL